MLAIYEKMKTASFLQPMKESINSLVNYLRRLTIRSLTHGRPKTGSFPWVTLALKALGLEMDTDDGTKLLSKLAEYR